MGSREDVAAKIDQAAHVRINEMNKLVVQNKEKVSARKSCDRPGI